MEPLLSSVLLIFLFNLLLPESLRKFAPATLEAGVLKASLFFRNSAPNGLVLGLLTNKDPEGARLTLELKEGKVYIDPNIPSISII